MYCGMGLFHIRCKIFAFAFVGLHKACQLTSPACGGPSGWSPTLQLLDHWSLVLPMELVRVCSAVVQINPREMSLIASCRLDFDLFTSVLSLSGQPLFSSTLLTSYLVHAFLAAVVVRRTASKSMLKSR